MRLIAALKRYCSCLLGLALLAALLPAISRAAALEKPAAGGELRLALHGEPQTLDPWLSDDEASDTLRFLTQGVLIRMNRHTQQPEAELATSWKVAGDGKSIAFQLRKGVKFPDGTPFTSADVVSTFQRLLDPALHAPIADGFKFAQGNMKVRAAGDYTVIAEFPVAVPGSERLFDLAAIVSAKAATHPAPGLGPFLVADYKPGGPILLKRNPNYWKRDSNGQALPRLDSIRFDVQQNRDLELLKFRRGESHMIESLSPDLFERLQRDAPGTAIDSGPSLDSEFLWFNQSPGAPIPANKKGWFRSAAFRRAVSGAINRADIARLVYKGHASPASGPVSPANKLWFNAAIKLNAVDAIQSFKQLNKDGLALQAGVLKDRTGAPVEFSIITNAGNKSREMMATLIQQDLAQLGIKINIVTLDFPSLIERITRSFDYEACLLGFTNVEADPNGMMNIFLSSASNHAWNPSQKTPATEWEAELDRLMLSQAATPDYKARKKSFDRVQEIIRAQAPFIYLVHPNALSAVGPAVGGASPSAFYPHTFWNAERLTVKMTGKKNDGKEKQTVSELSQPLLSVRLTADYPNKPGVLRELALDVQAGEIVGLVGRSGEGKSTITMAILGLLGFKGGRASGQILFRGRDLLGLGNQEMREVRGKEIGLVPQSPLASLNPHLRLISHLEEARRAHNGVKTDWGALMRSVSLPASAEFLRGYPRNLSVGMAQRFLIALAMVHRPPLLLADEPTSALDLITQAEILQLFEKINREQGVAMLYISHDLASVASLCHRVAILHRGQIVECGTTADVFAQPQHEYTKRLIAAIPQVRNVQDISAQNSLGAMRFALASDANPLTGRTEEATGSG